MNKKIHLILPIILLTSCTTTVSSTSFSSSSDSSSTSTSVSSTSSSSTSTSTSVTSSTSSSQSSSSSSSSSSSQPVIQTKEWTIMIYMCGSSLESEYASTDEGLATANITDILSVDLDDDINVYIETGGAKKWSKTYDIANDKLSRYHVYNNELVLDETINKSSMGKSSTFASFVEYGINNYPANHYGVILWNHGGAMLGCCFDENYRDDPLTNKETKSALQTVFENTKREAKFDWIGYDACLMSVADIASFNSSYFKYMVSSQENEPGEGWDYKSWLTTLSKDISISTEDLLKNITDTYVQKSADTYESWYEYDPIEYAEYHNFNDATLSVLDLSKMTDFDNEFNNMCRLLEEEIDSKQKYSSILKTAQQFGYDSNFGYAFDVFDADDVINNIKSKHSSIDVSKCLDSLSDVICYNKVGKNNEGACGLSLFGATSTYFYKSDYPSTTTNYSSWRNIAMNYGSWGSSR